MKDQKKLPGFHELAMGKVDKVTKKESAASYASKLQKLHKLLTPKGIPKNSAKGKI